MNMTMTQMVKDREVNPLVNSNNKNKAGVNGNSSARVIKSSGNFQGQLQPSLFHQEDNNVSKDAKIPLMNPSNYNFINYGDKI